MAEVFGIPVADLPDVWTPTEAVVMTKCVDLSSGEGGPAAVRYSTRATKGLAIVEAIGMARAALADLEQQYLSTVDDA